MIHPRHTLAEVARVIVGLVFVLSGLLKAVDPVGTALKIGQYLTPILDVHGPKGEVFTLALSFILCGSEFLLGAFLLMGVYRKLCARLSLLFMVVMTAVSLYSVLAHPVSDCGCFGDAIRLTPLETFLKNLILLPLSFLVLRDARALRHLYSRRERWVPAILAVVGIIYFMVNNYRHLPYRDFRPYSIGTDLRRAIVQEEEELQKALIGSTKYLYKKGGESKAFDATNLPDSSWTFVEAQQDTRLVDYLPKYDFSPLDSTGQSVAQELLEGKGITLLLLAPSWRTASQSVIDEVAELYQESLALGYHFYGVSASSSEETAEWRYQTGASYPMLQLDATPIRTIIRSQPGLVVLRDGRIIDKRAYADFPSVENVSHYLKGLQDSEAPLPSPSATRTYLLWAWAGLLLLGFLRFWARKLHLTIHLHLKKRLHLPQ